MKKLILLSAMMMAGCSSVLAYQPFIVEGRVWEYVHVVNANSCLTTVSKTFDGEVEFGGRLYSKFVTFRKSNYPDDKLSGTVVDDTGSVSSKSCYMREEGERVFILVDQYGEVVYDMDFTSPEASDVREAVIMDFALENGGEFPSDSFQQLEYSRLHKKDMGAVTYFDGVYPRYGLTDENNLEFPPVYAEVLGCLGDGFFPHNELYCAPNMTSEYLLSVYEPDGKVIYRAPSYEWLLNPDFSDRPRLIREDRVWEYVYSEYEYTPTFGKDADWGQQLFRVKFDGTEQHGDHVYHRLVHTGDLIRWTMKYDDATDDMVFVAREDLPNDNNRVYLMREEEGRVYMLNENLEHISSDEFMPDEFLVYDFNKTQGESYESWIGLWYWNGIPFEVMDYQFNVKTTETIEIDGEQCTVQNFTLLDDLSIIEGIGFVEHGFLPFLFCDMRTHIGGCMDCDLNRVYDAEGKIIYRGKDIDPKTVSVEKVNDKPYLSLKYEGNTVSAVNPTGTQVSLSVLDISGKVMSRVSGADRVSVSTVALTPGVYVAVAEADGATVARRKFVVR